MAQKIDLNLVEQINKRTGELEWFRIEVKIDNENNSSKIYRRYLAHSVPKSLESSLDIWKKTFSQIVNPRTLKNSTTAIEENLSQVFDEEDDNDDYGIRIDDDNYEEKTVARSQDEEDTRPNCWESYQNLTTELNNWLKSERWLKISDLLIEYFDKSGEIYVTIKTDSALSKQLPWQEWNIFKEYSQIEIAISPPEYEAPPGWDNIKRHPQVRILVILGDNDGINLEKDLHLLNEVRKYAGDPTFLLQPTLEELKTYLKEEKGWSIILYSGHSKTNENGQGVLYLNNDNKRGITIDNIENELRFAIDKGLYLAIFNSCDGLGIANKLTELHLPQSIVMKESIPDKMATHFLEYFLKSFSRDEPLFVAVRKTREKLKKQYNHSNKYPGGHLLPVIVANPTVPLQTWKSLISEYQLPLKLLVPIKIYLNLVEQRNKTPGEMEGFNVEVKIDNENNSSKIYRRYPVNSVPKSLESSLDQWKETFSQIVNLRSRKNSTTAIEENLSQGVDEEDDDDGITMDDDDYEAENVTKSQHEKDTRPNCWESYLNLTTEFNNWLKSERWLKVSDLLTEYLDKSGEISVTIQTDNALLKQLPWQEWEIFQEYEYSKIEIAISPPEYEPPPGWKNIKRHPQVRILVILGDSDNINTDRDSDLLNEVRKYGGNPIFLAQPTLEELKTELTEKKGWNIIFYSGHSKTNKNGQGVLYLNKSDTIGITIDDIEEELKVAIEEGLYLAIFNSCDGLGIANKLAELRFPQSIVMKESIPDKMAIDFLEYFLKSFSRDEPLFVAVGKARKELEKEYNKPDKYPGGHSLPLIVPNPAVPLPTWKSFLSEYQLPLKLLVPIIIGGFVGVFGLPLSIIGEFGYEKFLWYAKLYPHMIIYPMCAFWAVIWSVCQGWGQIINKSINKFKWEMSGVLFISIVLLYFEVTSPNMLLFELSQSAQSILEVSAIKGKLNSIKEIPLEIVNSRNILNEDKIIINKPTLEQALFNYLKLKNNNKITESQVIGFHDFMTLGLDFKITWKGRKNWVSISRWFYAYTFWLIIFTILIFFVLSIQLGEQGNFFDQNKYMKHLVFSQAMTILWIPFRLYYVNEPKNLIFNPNNLQWFQPLDICVVFTILVLSISPISNIIGKQKKNWILIIMTPVVTVLTLILGAQTQLLSLLFGLNTIDERIWILFSITTGLCVYLFFGISITKINPQKKRFIFIEELKKYLSKSLNKSTQ